MKKPKHGGKREGAGRHFKYGEVCKAITIRCPESKVNELKKVIKDTLKTFKSPA
jgi:hypothetical protein